jgi:hypothetical protein
MRTEKRLTIPPKSENPDGLHKRYVVIVDERTDPLIIDKLAEQGYAAFRQNLIDNGHSMIPPTWDECDELCRKANREMALSVVKGVLALEDPEAVYFVLRLDGKGEDKDHIDACRGAVAGYGMAVAGMIVRGRGQHLTKRVDDLLDLVQNMQEAEAPKPTRDDMLREAVNVLMTGPVGTAYHTIVTADVYEEAAAIARRRLGCEIEYTYDADEDGMLGGPTFVINKREY